MKVAFKFIALCTVAVFISCKPVPRSVVESPDASIVAKVGIEDGRIFYSITKDSRAIVHKSLLGFVLKDMPALDSGFRIEDVEHASFSSSWEPVWGEESIIEENYNEMRLRIEEDGELKRHFYITFRVFNDGFGFRYEFPEQENLAEFVIMDELTEFALADNHTSWSIPYDTEAYEALYREMSINELDTVCTPLTMKCAGGLHLAIHEANLTDYAAMNLHPLGNNTLKVYLTPWSTGEKVFMSSPHTTPWRTMIIADNAAELMLSRMMLNLNEPCRLEDTSWIKPGRYIGIWWAYHMKKYTWHEGPDHGATTENAKRYIDFAAEHDYSGVLVEGWNKGWDNWYEFSFVEPYSDFDLPDITEYAASKGIKLIGHHETGGNVINYENQIEDAFELYQKHGVNSVKTGYVGTLLNGKEMHSGQFAVRHYRHVIETAAKYKIMINNHEPVMPTGLQRTFPNLMTQEGVRGQEWDAWANDGGSPPSHTTIIPFTRGLAGPMDFTPGTFNFNNPAMPGTRVQTTLAKQLALSVVLYSPQQMSSDMIENYQNNLKAFEFLKSCPVNWERTVITEAEIGQYLTVVRKDKDSERWFVGSITNESGRLMRLPLDFLDPDVSYLAKIFKDGPDADYVSNPYPVAIEEIELNSEMILEIAQANGGGTAIIFSKKQ